MLGPKLLRVPFPESVRRKGQGCLSGVQLAVGARLMDESPLEAKCPLEERERGRDFWNVQDDVAKFHDEQQPYE